MSKAIKLIRLGDNQEYQIENLEKQSHKEGQVLVKNIASGINQDDVFINIPADKPYVIPGYSASGEIIEIGANITGFKPGDSVVYMTKNSGSFQENTVVDYTDLISVPEEIYDKIAGASYYSGMMAHSLLKRVFIVNSNIIILIHNVTSGIGYILAQWADSLGAVVIGSVDDDSKNNFALKYGCKKVINYKSENWVQEIMEFTKGYGVNAIYDSLGNDTFEGNIKCITKMGILVCYGPQSKTITNIDSNKIAEKSLYITFPSIFDYKSNKMERVLSSDELFSMIKAGRIKVEISDEFGLDNASQAFEKIKNNNVMGSIIINI